MRLLPVLILSASLIGCQAPSYPGKTTQPSVPLDLGAPWALTTEEPGIVVSPHAPNALVDVKGIARGRIVRDPDSNMLMRVP